MEYFVYILESLSDHNHYVSITRDVEHRLIYHNRGYVRSTKHRIPLRVIYTESFTTRAEAREREKYLKSYKGAKEKISIIERFQ